MNKVLSILSILAIAVIFSACAPTATSVKVEGDGYGEVKKVKNVISYDQLLAKMAVSEDAIEDVQVEAKVNEVCQVKGCWMTLYSDNAADNQMMVKFKDYAFFMPKDIPGKTVIVQGKAFREVTSVDELRHYAEDAGKSKDEIAKITEPKVELKFEATGVIIKKS